MMQPQRKLKSAGFISVLIAIFMIIGCFTTACQPTPENAIIINKNDNTIEEIISSSAAPAIEFIIPAKWDITLNKDNVYVDVHGEIVLPDVSEIPVMSIKPLQFTQSDVDKALDVFFNGKTPLEYDVRTKQMLDTIIIENRKQLDAIYTGNLPPDYEEGDKERLEQNNENLIREYNDAPDESIVDTKPADTTLHKDDKNNSHLTMVANLRNDEYATLQIGNHASINSAFIQFDNRNKNIIDDIAAPYNDKKPNGVVLTLEQATKRANDILGLLEIDNMMLVNTNVVNFYKEKTEFAINESNLQAYEFIYLKNYNNIIVTNHNSGMMKEDILSQEDSHYSAVLYPEIIKIQVDDSGIIYFSWNNPTNIINTTSTNVPIKEFDDIKNIFENHIFYHQWYGDPTGELHININKIELSYFIQPIKDKQHEYRAIPVWDFIGSFTTNDKVIWENSSFLTINAIDGSVIDRNRGY